MATVPNKYVENVEFQVSSISYVTINIKDDGTDTDAIKYMDMGSDATSTELRTDQIVTIDEINGFVLKDPITVNANTNFTVSRKGRLRIRTLKIHVLTASTNLKLIAFTSGRRGD